ncbi:MAG: effector binding domain-containing protein [Oscillospiraceae bacterium]|nr:effector binding domain-containing protein [Oscillospiraceae bacterium]
MQLQTINQVSKAYGVSARMLRYYEQIGLIESQRKEDYAYRVYDETALLRLRQIIILRKLRVPMRQISAILNQPDASEAVEIFRQNIRELDDEINALSLVKDILSHLANQLQQRADIKLDVDVLSDSSILSIVDSMSLSKNHMKERISMDAFHKATEVLNKLHDVRVVHLPPMTVAAIRLVCKNPEEKTAQKISKFIKKHNLLAIKPDLRQFGFNHPLGNDLPGHEMWVSIPHDMEVAEPFEKKQFHGGLFAAYVAKPESVFETWLGLQDWVNESDEYQYNVGFTRVDPHLEEVNSFGGVSLTLEEQLNLQNPDAERQLDLLIPIKAVEIIEETSLEIPDSVEKCGHKTSLMTKNKFAIVGFTTYMTEYDGDPGNFFDKLVADGRFELLRKYGKPGAPCLNFGSHDLDSQKHGTWRTTVGLFESDVIDMQALMEQGACIKKIDASKWLCFAYKGTHFDGHSNAPKLGYTFNGTISGHVEVYNVWREPSEDEISYHWYPVK